MGLDSPMKTAAVKQDLLEDFSVTTETSSSLLVHWSWKDPDGAAVNFMKFSRIFYMLTTNSEIVQSPKFYTTNITEFRAEKLIPDSDYRVCIQVFKKGNLSHLAEDYMCDYGSTSLWHISASIGSTVGAFVALAIIVLLVFLSQCIHWNQTYLRDNSGPESRINLSRTSSSSMKRAGGGAGSKSPSYPDSGFDCEMVQLYDPALGNYVLVRNPAVLLHDEVGASGVCDDFHSETENCVTLQEGTFPCSCGFVHVLQPEEECREMIEDEREDGDGEGTTWTDDVTWGQDPIHNFKS